MEGLAVHTRQYPSIAVLTVAVGPGLACGQWVSFTDETGGRLSLNAFADNPGGNPLLDGTEKDIAVGDLDLDGW